MRDVQPYFRDAVPGDIPAISAILRTAPHLADRERVESDGTYRDALAEIDRTDGNYVLVAEYDNQIGAMLQMLAFRHLHHRGGRTAEIVAMHVAESFRTSGISGMLVDHAIERSRDLGCRRVQVLSSTALTSEHTFWERHGFVQLDRGYVKALT
jgi:GNAT superfamily N-acetyltransferase